MFLLNIYPGLEFFYMIFWYFFLLLLWSIIWHQLFLLLATFDFSPMEKMATCVTPRIRDFGHWFWKISHGAHNLQPFNGLIKKTKTKAVAISHPSTIMWLTNLQPVGTFLEYCHKILFLHWHFYINTMSIIYLSIVYFAYAVSKWHNFSILPL